MAAFQVTAEVDLGNRQIIATIPTFSSAFGIAINSAGTRAYVTNGVVIDTVTNSVAGFIPLQSGICSCVGTGIAVSPDGTRVYVPHFGLSSIAVADTSTNSVISYIRVGNNPSGIALNSSGTRLYVANRDSGSVSVINTATNAVVTTIAVGDNPVAFGQFVGPAPH